jgi:hypothetical protein
MDRVGFEPTTSAIFLDCSYVPKGTAMERKLCVRSGNFTTRIIKEVTSSSDEKE